MEVLICTTFEKEMKMINYKKGDRYFFEKDREATATYIIKGSVQYTLFIPDGGEYIISLQEDNLQGVNISIGEIDGDKYEVEIFAKEDTRAVKIPFRKVFDMEFQGKESILKKLLLKASLEYNRRFRFFVYKSIKTDEELLLKGFELKKLQGIKTRDISERLNINLRTLQRLTKKLVDKGIIYKEGNGFEVVSYEKLREYQETFEK